MADLILPLSLAESRYLQVLVRDFKLTRIGEGTLLEISIENDYDAIWNDLGKNAVRRMIPDFKNYKKEFQKKLDDFLLFGRGQEFYFKNEKKDFLFRYGSGGTLPIIRQNNEDYFCLFYREKFPIGWNIANGGFDSRLEMLYPVLAIERELHEELIIVDPVSKRRLKFYWEANKPMDRPEFGTAHLLWTSKLASLGYYHFKEENISLSWENGPDLLRVKVGDEGPKTTTGCFLNINALDFGIEIDRIARIVVPDSAVFMDGEIVEHKLINAPIGLFEVKKMKRILHNADWNIEHKIIPDCFFYSGKKYDGSEIDNVVTTRFVPRLITNNTISQNDFNAFNENNYKFDLCPVTRRIIKRAIKGLPGDDVYMPSKIFQYDVFISYRRSDRDTEFAWDLRERLEKAGISVAIDDDAFDPAARFLEEMERCVKTSRYTLAVVSNQYLESENCIEEAIICKVIGMREREGRLIPLNIEKTERPIWLHGIVGIDFYAENPPIDPYVKLLQTLSQNKV